MKKLENKQTTLKMNDKEAKYSDLIKICINAPVQGGFNIQQIKQRLRISEALETDGDLKFEDNDADNLQEIVSEFKWATVHKDVVQFVEDVQNMKRVK